MIQLMETLSRIRLYQLHGTLWSNIVSDAHDAYNIGHV